MKQTINNFKGVSFARERRQQQKLPFLDIFISSGNNGRLKSQAY